MLATLVLPALVLTVPVSAESPKAQASHAGSWAGAIQVPGVELQILVELTAGEPWKGTIAIPQQGLKGFALGDVLVNGAEVSFRMAGIPGDPAFQGQVAADGVLRGTFTQGGQRFPFTLKRAPAKGMASEAPATSRSSLDREVAFPGFNAMPLKGSVRTAQGHGYFAVMVAGSGPTDRDWSNPLIRDPQTGKLTPSHGGRDFAEWLAKQGIGSLRWDKRFIGSQDPKLDISLDAQVGDIRAALAYARTLPEAKGRKLLLVGHSEGSLLSLLAAKDADAVLLLALPPQSMAKTIVAQVKLQLPEDRAAANLAYLESVFTAIRTNQPTPEAGIEVIPALVTNLAKPLMRPESLGFVRDTLDLDPWALAVRVPVPCAVVWGDRDVQTWKPAALPTAFPGSVIEIPEANHLLKRETRPRVELNGANAVSTYGDATPLADLALLAAWLKELK
jgi:hypothetical protein